jgi:hypothetical protein
MSYPLDRDVRSCHLYKQKVHYRVDKSPRLGPIFGQFNPVHTRTPYYSNTILQSAPRSTKWSPFRISGYILYEFIIYPCVLRAPPISTPLINWAKYTNHEGSCCVNFSILLEIHLSSPLNRPILPNTLFSHSVL